MQCNSHQSSVPAASKCSSPTATPTPAVAQVWHIQKPANAPNC
uniref:Uncharacterized protein n=1 Tax=Arundo donax TaxID=35708 RepID=A0A0A9FX40_ARUDO